MQAVGNEGSLQRSHGLPHFDVDTFRTLLNKNGKVRESDRVELTPVC